jgi:hypothetical protein
MYINKQPGIALIISNRDFTNPREFPVRTGTEVDAENLRQLFTQLGYEVVARVNLTATVWHKCVSPEKTMSCRKFATKRTRSQHVLMANKIQPLLYCSRMGKTERWVVVNSFIFTTSDLRH